VYGEKFSAMSRDTLFDLKNERNSVGPALDNPQRLEYEEMAEMEKARAYFLSLN